MARNTRTANTVQHPGNPDKKRHRHTKAEMEEYRAQEAEKQKQKDLDQKAKIDRIASVEQRLTDELNVTPRPAIKQRPLRRTTTFLELPLDDNPKDSITDESSLSAYNDGEFEPPTDRADTEVETETEAPPKKKKTTVKEPVRTAIKAALARDPEGGKKGLEGSVAEEPTKGHPIADGKKLPHGDNVFDRRPESADRKAPDDRRYVLICDQLFSGTMLTLDPTTLFYLSLMETSNPKKAGLIDS
jgi:hypothetical protein